MPVLFFFSFPYVVPPHNVIERAEWHITLWIPHPLFSLLHLFRESNLFISWFIHPKLWIFSTLAVHPWAHFTAIDFFKHMVSFSSFHSVQTTPNLLCGVFGRPKIMYALSQHPTEEFYSCNLTLESQWFKKNDLVLISRDFFTSRCPQVIIYVKIYLSIFNTLRHPLHL